MPNLWEFPKVNFHEMFSYGLKGTPTFSRVSIPLKRHCRPREVTNPSSNEEQSSLHIRKSSAIQLRTVIAKSFMLLSNKALDGAKS